MALHDDIIGDLDSALRATRSSRKRHNRFDAYLEKSNELEAAVENGHLTVWQVDGSGNRKEVVNLPIAEALHTLNPAVYTTLLQAWKKRNSNLVRLFDSRCREFGVMRDLIDLLFRDSIIPFVGAGMSVESGQPQWGQYLESLADDCSPLVCTQVLAAIKSYAFEDAAQLIADDRPSLFVSRLARDFREYDSSRVKGAVTLLPKIFPRAAITTNFDNIMEAAYLAAGNGFVRAAYGTTHENVVRGLIGGESCLWKLHGSHSEESTHVFTKAQYDRAYGGTGAPNYSERLPRFLRQIYVSRSLLFLGCRLSEDRTLRLFADVKGQSFSLPPHFALLEQPKDPIEQTTRANYLEQIGISPIWYPNGKHELVREFVELLIELKSGETKLAL